MKVSFLFARNQRWWAFLSPVIMSVSNTDFSHCAILLEWNGSKKVYHSEFPNGYCQEYADWLKTYKVMHQYTIEFSNMNYSYEIVKWLNKEVAKRYSVLQLFLILIYKTFPKSRDRISGWIINGDYKDICSEFVGSFMEKFFNVRFSKSDDLIDLNDALYMAQKIEWSKSL